MKDCSSINAEKQLRLWNKTVERFEYYTDEFGKRYLEGFHKNKKDSTYFCTYSIMLLIISKMIFQRNVHRLEATEYYQRKL